jgi:hypothetical protein
MEDDAKKVNPDAPGAKPGIGTWVGFPVLLIPALWAIYAISSATDVDGSSDSIVLPMFTLILCTPILFGLALKYALWKRDAAKAEVIARERASGREHERAQDRRWDFELGGVGGWVLAAIVAVVIGIAVGPLNEPEVETPEDKFIRDMKEGQEAVCKKWGDLRPEC